MNKLDNKNAKGVGAWKSKFWLQDIIQMADFDKNIILPHVQCGHLALSTCLETWLNDAVFEINVTKYMTQKIKIEKYQCVLEKTKKTYLSIA